MHIDIWFHLLCYLLLGDIAIIPPAKDNVNSLCYLLLDFFRMQAYTSNRGDNMTTGQRIQQARKKAGLSQKQLGEKLGLSASMIGQWENDLRNPKIETLFRIADALNVDIGDLYDFSIQAERDRTLAEINQIKTELHTAQGQEREELESTLAILEESYEDVTIAIALQNLSKDTPKCQKTNREKIVDAFDMLNSDGQERAVERVEELTEIPRYRRHDSPEPPIDTSGDEAAPEPPVAPSCNEDPAPQSPSTISGRKDPAPPPEGTEEPPEGE